MLRHTRCRVCPGPATLCWCAHRVRRDAFNADLTAAGAPERPAATGYTLPVEVTGPESAAAALLAAEEDCTRALYALLEQADTPEVRRQAVDALVECGVRAAHWRAVLGQSPVTVAFPGRPE